MAEIRLPATQLVEDAEQVMAKPAPAPNRES